MERKSARSSGELPRASVSAMPRDEQQATSTTVTSTEAIESGPTAAQNEHTQAGYAAAGGGAVWVEQATSSSSANRQPEHFAAPVNNAALPGTAHAAGGVSVASAGAGEDMAGTSQPWAMASLLRTTKAYMLFPPGGRLPCFGGNPLDWDAFYLTYTASTRLYSISDAYNRERLRRVLYGPALALVQRLLDDPTCSADDIMSRLHLRYYRVTILFLSRYADLMFAAAKPCETPLEKLTNFREHVVSFIVFLKQNELDNVVDNIDFVYGVVGFLPPMFRILWVIEYAEGGRLYHLVTFIAHLIDNLDNYFG